jgi:hypothetical protein
MNRVLLYWIHCIRENYSGEIFEWNEQIKFSGKGLVLSKVKIQKLEIIIYDVRQLSIAQPSDDFRFRIYCEF